MTDSEPFDVVAVNVAICEALGFLPSNVQAITIRLEATRPPEVTVEYAPHYLANFPEFEGTLARFELVPARDPVA